MATFEEQYKKYSTSGQGQAINDLYDAKKKSQLNQLESAYQASRAEAEAARDKPVSYTHLTLPTICSV